jgi:hypothetical protein
MATEYDVLRSLLIHAENENQRIGPQFVKNGRRSKLLSLLDFLLGPREGSDANGPPMNSRRRSDHR